MRRYSLRTGIQFAFASLLFIAGCSGQQSSVSPDDVSHSNRRRPTLDPRPNPLQTYIQSTWTSGSPSATGGSIYSHIKLYGHNYTNLGNYPSDAEFIATHFDVYMWGGPIVGSTAATLNPTMLWLQECANIPHIRAFGSPFDSLRVEEWMGDPATNPNGYTWADIALHYRVNTSNWVSTQLGLPYFPGWNPDDDANGDGCIGAGEGNNGQPSDPNRSAPCIADARALNPSRWIKGDVTSQAYIDFTAWEAKDEWAVNGVDGFHFDEAAYASENIQLGNTFTYWGMNENSSTFPYIEDKIAFVPAVMAQVEAFTGSPVIVFANMVNATSAVYEPFQKEKALQYLENVQLERWLANSGVALAMDYKRWAMLDGIYTDYLSAGKGVVLACRDDGQAPSERMKVFSLAMFYMINHQMAFYMYLTQSQGGPDIESWSWNPWVAYDVGQPANNSFGYEDFLGQTGTNRFFVMGTDDTGEWLGRQYYRSSDVKGLLVVAKLMKNNKTPGADPRAIQLPGYYRRVQVGFTLGPVISQLTLTNNEGAILVRETKGPNPGS